MVQDSAGCLTQSSWGGNVALRNSTPLKWVPSGTSDTLDATNTFTGAMAALTNLIPDRTTRGLWVCRPASIQQTSFVGFLTAAFVSCFRVIGTKVYGLVSTTRNGGHDEPFCFDVATGAFVAVSGVTAANTPVSPAAAGAWVPPRMALIGTKLVVTHQGFVGTGKFIGWFDVSNPALPAWDAGNVAINPLTVVPVDVFNFSGRAYYAENTATVAGLPFSDVLDPLTRTLADQVLTLDDNVPCTALGGLPLNNTQGSKVQTLVAFKGVTRLYLITGDKALNNLQKTLCDVQTGTLAPNSLCATSKGLAFTSPDGVRIIDFQGNVSDPLGTDGMGVTVPFIYAVEPSRIAAACNGDTLRVSTQNGNALGAPNQEYWFDLARKIWSGPHSFAASLMQPYSNAFIKTATGVVGKLFRSDLQQSLTSTFIENGVQMTFNFSTPLLPDTDQMCEVAVVETTLDTAYTAGVPAYSASINDENNTAFDTLALSPSGAGSFWGNFNWGEANWLGTPNALAPRNLAWHLPIVFRRAYLAVTGQCSIGAKFGALRMRYERLGYLQQALGGSA